MKIAVLADVHANVTALEAVVAHARSQGAETFWNLGDSVGYSPFPNETVRLLQKISSHNILGNYDRKVLSEKRILKMREGHKDQDKVFSFEWTHKALDPDVREVLSAFAPQVRLDVEGNRVLLLHGSPESDEEGVTSRTASTRLETLAQAVAADVVLCAHTHRALERVVGGVRWINPGSVGRSFDGDPRAAYAMCEITASGVTTEFFRVAYDVRALVEEMKARQFPPRLIQSLLEARSLDDLDIRSGATADQILRAVVECGRECRYEKEHAHQVARLALKVFDGLLDLHGLGLRERLWLQAAALLHDVGLVYGVDGHHKSSRDIILKAEKIPFTDRERTIVALIARYHRKGLPEADHRFYQDLSFYDREIVDTLAGILRVADGLDRGHKNLVTEVVLDIRSDTIQLRLESQEAILKESATAIAKGDLLEYVFARRLVIPQ